MTEPLFYLDTSALLPYYRPEPASQAVEDFLRGVDRHVFLSRLTDVELASALARLVRRGELSEPDVLLIEHAYLDDLREGRFSLGAVPLRSFTRAREWLFSRKVELRTLNALHLAACIEASAVMVTCDRELHRSATAVGVSSRLIE